MKKFLTIVLIFVALSSAFSQGKLLTMEDAVLGREFRIENPANLMWIGESNCYCFADSFDGEFGLLKNERDSEKQTLVLSLDDLNDALSGLRITLRAFPRLTWIDTDSFYFLYRNRLIIYSIRENKAEEVNRITGDFANIQIEPNSHRLAFTRGDNLFAALDAGTEIQITFDGGDGISSGQPDVHRSEFGINRGIFWSPKGRAVAFYRRDESMVTNYPLVDLDSRPATLRYERYPMAGMVSEQVTVGVHHIATGSTIFLETGQPHDQYLPHVTWSPDGKRLYIVHLNRDQNHLRLIEYDAITGRPIRKILEEQSDKWVEPEHGPLFITGEDEKFIWFSRRDGYNNLYQYNLKGNLVKQLTKGKQDITGIIAVSNSGRALFYSAASPDGMDRHSFRLDLKTGKSVQLTKGAGTHTEDFSADGSLFIDRLSSSTIPSKIILCDDNGDEIRVLLEAENPLQGYNLGETKYLKIKNSDGIELNARMILPIDFNPEKKYPVVVYVYGGPHGQMITDAWPRGFWFHYMAQEGYIVFTLDNRGTNNRGLAFEQAIHRNLGDVEVADQMAGIEYLKSLPYVDAGRLGVHGWSYGGFMTVSMMTRQPGVFKVGVAGGPVIDWKLYEVMYGERYMDTPQSNPEGYERSNLLNYVKDLDGKLLLIHGTVDPIVVWQHSLLYLRKAIDLGKQIDYFVYPGDEHNMRGRDRLHLYQKITDYFLVNL